MLRPRAEGHLDETVFLAILSTGYTDLRDAFLDIQQEFLALEDGRDGFKPTLEAIDLHVNGRTSVAKDVIYPMFERLSRNYQAMAERRREMDSLLGRMAEIKQLWNSHVSALENDLTNAAGSWPVFTASKQSGDPEGCKNISSDSDDFLNMRLDLSGYCPATLVEHGVLSQGNPLHGLLTCNHRCFAFRDEAAKDRFQKSWEAYCDELSTLTHKHPMLTWLEGIAHQDVEHLISKLSIESSRQLDQDGPLMVDAGCSTDTHPVASVRILLIIPKS